MRGELKKIKKKYGEDFAKLCRTLFPTVLETEGLLYSLLDSKFAHSKFLYNDLVEKNLVYSFKDYIYGLLEKRMVDTEINKSARELLSEAGYDLYECKTEDEIQSFKKYYANGEALCTFNGGRLNRCYVFFAVKKNVSEIRREDFLNPQRQDEYGTSVISIQFTRDSSNTLSIKNRYNHRVLNPDATFSNDLEQIIPGLTRSFERDYGLCINNGGKKLEIPGYVLASDGKYYKYNYEINNVYYGPDNLIIDNFKVQEKYQDKSRYLVFDYFIIDLSKKTIMLYDQNICDSFLDEISINSIEISNSSDKQSKNIIINNDIEIVIDKGNKMIEYKNNHLRKFNNDFLHYNRYLKKISTPNVMKVGDDCLFYNNYIEAINLPKALYVGKRFLYFDKKIRELHMEKVVFTGIQFCFCCEDLEIVNMPSLEQPSGCFCRLAKKVEELYLPHLLITGNDFMSQNYKLKRLYAPNLKEVGKYFLTSAGSADDVYMPNLSKIDEGFFFRNLTVYKKYKKR